jgi:hypothetical protein
MNFASGLLGKAIIKSKTASIERSVSSAATFEEEPKGGLPEKTRRGRFSKEDKAHFLALVHSEFGVGLSILSKEKRWVKYSQDEDLAIDNLSRKNFPVTAYRCVGELRTAATLKDLAAMAFELDHRRKWDAELTRETRTIEALADDAVLEYEARGSSMGGVVSGRGYVDLRGRQLVDKSEARVYWGSVKWDAEMEDGLVRAWNYNSGLLFRKLEEGRYQMILILHRDVRGWLPYAAAEQAMGGSIAYQWRVFAKYAQSKFP